MECRVCVRGSVSRAAFALIVILGAVACRAQNRLYMADDNALGPYSASVHAGDHVFVSGQIGSKRDGTFEQEVESAIDAVEQRLGRHKLDLSDVVSATVYLTDMTLYPELNEVYAKRFTTPYPVRACVAVKALPAGARVEIMVVALGG